MTNSYPSPLPINQARHLLHGMLDETSAVDAPSAYYALYHDPKRSVVFLRQDAQRRVLGYVGRFQTGIDLFRPVVNLHCWSPDVTADLLAEALKPGWSYLLFAKLNQLALVGGSMQVHHERILSIYALDPSRFKPQINVLLVHKTTPDGFPRVEINSNGIHAVAGINWQSPGFAEIYVNVDPEARQKGWGIAVVTGITERILSSGRLPLYLVEPSNEPSVRLARGAGYIDTGARQVYAECEYVGHPIQR